MEDKVRMVGVRRCFVDTRVDPTWAVPRHPSPLSLPLRPSLPGSPASGTARVPAPRRKRRAIRRAKKRPRYSVCAAASVTLLPLLGAADETFANFAGLLYTYSRVAVKRRTAECGAVLADGTSLSYNALHLDVADEVGRWPFRCKSFFWVLGRRCPRRNAVRRERRSCMKGRCSSSIAAKVRSCSCVRPAYATDG
jgi:hypothetical protein